MLQVELRIDGQPKVFVQDFISGRMFRRTLEMQKLFESKDGKNVVDERHLDTMVDYVVELFGHKFDRDQFYDGIAANRLMSTITGCINAVSTQSSEALGTGTDPN